MTMIDYEQNKIKLDIQKNIHTKPRSSSLQCFRNGFSLEETVAAPVVAVVITDVISVIIIIAVGHHHLHHHHLFPHRPWFLGLQRHHLHGVGDRSVD
ncbi:hypothetical protein LguiB_032887 [Lonicera macranthoides]